MASDDELGSDNKVGVGAGLVGLGTAAVVGIGAPAINAAYQGFGDKATSDKLIDEAQKKATAAGTAAETGINTEFGKLVNEHGLKVKDAYVDASNGALKADALKTYLKTHLTGDTDKLVTDLENTLKGEFATIDSTITDAAKATAAKSAKVNELLEQLVEPFNGKLKLTAAKFKTVNGFAFDAKAFGESLVKDGVSKSTADMWAEKAAAALKSGGGEKLAEVERETEAGLRILTKASAYQKSGTMGRIFNGTALEMLPTSGKIAVGVGAVIAGIAGLSLANHLGSKSFADQEMARRDANTASNSKA